MKILIHLFFLTDDIAIISFEMAAYSVDEGEGGLEVCAVPSAALLPGESISVLVSTQDGTATGKKLTLLLSLNPHGHYIL